jgi:hypothetical protein
MTMTKDELIEQASKCYQDGRKACGVESDITLDEIDAAFCAGAEWAHAATVWHKADISDPVQPEEDEPYICYDGFCYFVGHIIKGEWYSHDGEKERPIVWCKFQHSPED